MDLMMTNNLSGKPQHGMLADAEIISASAPGRLDVMGGVADYSGSMVLQSTIKERTTVFISNRSDGKIFLSTSFTKEEITIDSSFINQLDYDKIRNQVPSGWAHYVLGCLFLVSSEKKITINGLYINIESDIPAGKGVSSSAAIEVATLSALNKLYNLNLGDKELPTLAQKVENILVGAPCGIMDQLSSYLGDENKLLPILCQPDITFANIKIPENINFIGIDSGIRHSIGGASYGDVRTAAFMGYSIIARYMGISNEILKEAKKTSDWSCLPYKGYLANISPSDFTNRFSLLIPEIISGKEFIEEFGFTIDKITSPIPDKNYYVKACTAHPVQENFRVNLFVSLLNSLNQLGDNNETTFKTLTTLGELMFQSHASYSLCDIGNKNTDILMNLAKEIGPENGIFGAKISGGGSGGTVVFLAYGEAGLRSIDTIKELYKKTTLIDPYIFSGSSKGGKYNK